MSRFIEFVYKEHHQIRERYGFIFGERVRANLIANFVGKEKKVLDLGCRDGSLTRFYYSSNQVIGLDIDIDALKRCKETLGLTVLLCDLNEGLPFKDNYFDVVVAGELLEHLPFPWMLLRDVYRVLKVGGILVGSVPNAYHWRKRIRFLLGKDLDEDPTHLRFFSKGSLTWLLEAEKFRDIRIIPYSSGAQRNVIKALLVRCFPTLFSSGFVFWARKKV